MGERPLQTQLALLERLPDDVEIAFDPGEIYARLGVKCFIPFLKRASFVFATESELETLCGLPADKALSFLLDVGVGLVVCKMGDRGAQIIGRRLDLYVPPHPAEVVDVTGAGDLFAAGFIGGAARRPRPRGGRPPGGLGGLARHRRARAQHLPRRGGLARTRGRRTRRRPAPWADRGEDRLAVQRPRPGRAHVALRGRAVAPGATASTSTSPSSSATASAASSPRATPSSTWRATSA